MRCWNPVTSIFSGLCSNLRAARGASLALFLVLLSAVPAAAVTTLKIATVTPNGSPGMKLLKDAAAEIEQATESRVKFKFYPGGVMGDDTAVLRKMRVGQLHGGVLTTAVFNKVFTDIQLYNLPMQFRRLEEVDYIRSKLDEQLMQGLEENGFVTFGLAEVGMAYAMSTQPARTVQDGRQLKVWTPQGDPASARAISAFDITPIPLTIADVLAGLQTGLIDTVAMPPVGALALQWHTQLRYVLDLPLMYVYGVFVVSDRGFKKIDAADQAIVREVMGRAIRTVDERNRQDHDAAVAVLREQGIDFIEPTTEEAESWQTYADAASARWVEDGIVSEPLFRAMNEHLAQFRDGAPN